MHSVDYLITGVTGQIGRYFLRDLVLEADIAVVMRRSSRAEAEDELLTLVKLKDKVDEIPDLDIILGDICECELPLAKYIINASGYTSLQELDFRKYVVGNINPAIKLAHHAKKTGAELHHMSSISVAEQYHELHGWSFEEYCPALPHLAQLPYARSKCLAELAIKAIAPQHVCVHRLGDVVPPLEYLDEDWRDKHWLPITFSCGRSAFDHAPYDYGVWLADTKELAEAVLKLIHAKHPVNSYHVLGCLYDWSSFRKYVENAPVDHTRVARWITDIILYGPNGHHVCSNFTNRILTEEGFEWNEKSEEYWQAFAKKSFERRHCDECESPAP